MDKSPVALAHAYRLLNPGPVLLVSVGDGTEDNLFSASWNMPVRKDPPMVSVLVGKGHHSWEFIARSGELGLNIPDASLADAVLGCGLVSGRHEADKFSRFGLTRMASERIKAPLVAECVAHLECRVSQVHDLGASALVVAQVVAARASTEHFVDGNWSLDHGLRLLHHLSGERFLASPELVLAKGL